MNSLHSLNLRTKYLLLLLAGAVMTLGFAPFNSWSAAFSYLVFACLALFFYLLNGIASARQAFLGGWLFGIGLFSTGVSWIYVAIHDFGAAHWSLAALLTAVFILFVGAYYGLLAWCIVRIRGCFLQPSTVLNAAVLAMLWVSFEWLRSWVLSGFPWLLSGYPMIQTPLAGFAPVVGIYGLSFLAALLPALLVTGKTKSAAVSIALLLFSSGYGLSRVAWTDVAGAPLRVTIVQGNVSQEVRWQQGQLEKTMRLYQYMSAPYWNYSDLIVWPENAIPVFYHTIEKHFYRPLRQKALDSGTELVTGLPVYDNDTERYYNGLVNLGEKQGFYYKSHLVPFGEYVPLESWLRGIIDFFDLPMSSFAPGEPRQPLLQISGYKVAATLCYEDVYAADLLYGIPESRFMINLSNNGWYGNSLAPHQHLEMAKMRALETGREIIRSTTSGISAIIDSRGELRVSGPQFEQAVIRGEVNPRSGRTPFVFWRNIPLLVLFLFLAAYVVKHCRTGVRREA